MVKGAAALFGKDKVYKSALGLVGKWLKPDGAQVTKIREKLGAKRVIVFIDDLDRATPELLPKLLLSLREFSTYRASRLYWLSTMKSWQVVLSQRIVHGVTAIIS